MALVNSGRNLIAGLVAGTGTPLDASNAYIGVGDSNTAVSAAQTDLVGSNKHREAVNGAPNVSTNVVTWEATFEAADAQFAWTEWALFNASSSGAMLCRKVANHGTKAADEWDFEVSVTFAIGS